MATETLPGAPILWEKDEQSSDDPVYDGSYDEDEFFRSSFALQPLPRLIEPSHDDDLGDILDDDDILLDDQLVEMLNKSSALHLTPTRARKKISAPNKRFGLVNTSPKPDPISNQYTLRLSPVRESRRSKGRGQSSRSDPKKKVESGDDCSHRSLVSTADEASPASSNQRHESSSSKGRRSKSQPRVSDRSVRNELPNKNRTNTVDAMHLSPRGKGSKVPDVTSELDSTTSSATTCSLSGRERGQNHVKGSPLSSRRSSHSHSTYKSSRQPKESLSSSRHSTNSGGARSPECVLSSRQRHAINASRLIRKSGAVENATPELGSKGHLRSSRSSTGTRSSRGIPVSSIGGRRSASLSPERRPLGEDESLRSKESSRPRTRGQSRISRPTSTTISTRDGHGRRAPRTSGRRASSASPERRPLDGNGLDNKSRVPSCARSNGYSRTSTYYRHYTESRNNHGKEITRVKGHRSASFSPERCPQDEKESKKGEGKFSVVVESTISKARASTQTRTSYEKRVSCVGVTRSSSLSPERRALDKGESERSRELSLSPSLKLKKSQEETKAAEVGSENLWLKARSSRQDDILSFVKKKQEVDQSPGREELDQSDQSTTSTGESNQPQQGRQQQQEKKERKRKTIFSEMGKVARVTIGVTALGTKEAINAISNPKRATEKVAKLTKKGARKSINAASNPLGTAQMVTELTVKLSKELVNHATEVTRGTLELGIETVGGALRFDSGMGNESEEDDEYSSFDLSSRKLSLPLVDRVASVVSSEKEKTGDLDDEKKSKPSRGLGVEVPSKLLGSKGISSTSWET